MATHNALPVAGYTAQNSDKVDLVNQAKALEERVLRQMDYLRTRDDVDQRMVSLAVTKLQEAFMWANRAVFQPGRIELPEDRKD